MKRSKMEPDPEEFRRGMAAYYARRMVELCEVAKDCGGAAFWRRAERRAETDGIVEEPRGKRDRRGDGQLTFLEVAA